MTNFFLIRHGETGVIGKAIVGRSPGFHLTPEGHTQAASMAESLAREKIDLICSSPMERTRETAEPLARRLNRTIEIAQELNEVEFGDWTGGTLDRLETQPRWRRFNAYRSGTRPPGGESMLEVQLRIVGLMQRLCEEHPDRGVALVSHGDVIRAALMHFLGMPIDLFLRLEVSPASVSNVAVTEWGPKVLYINRTEYLPVPGNPCREDVTHVESKSSESGAAHGSSH